MRICTVLHLLQVNNHWMLCLRKVTELLWTGRVAIRSTLTRLPYYYHFPICSCSYFSFFHFNFISLLIRVNVCAIVCQSATMLVLCSNVTVSVKKFTCASVHLEWSLDQLGRHINIFIIIITIICSNVCFLERLYIFSPLKFTIWHFCCCHRKLRMSPWWSLCTLYLLHAKWSYWGRLGSLLLCAWSMCYVS